jgi:O-antigen/teichoic acid export membrane protein
MAQTGAEPTVPAQPSSQAARRRAEVGGGGLRHRVARGTIVNAVFLVAVNALTLLQGFIAARLLGASEYGLWGMLLIVFGTLLVIAAIGFDDKYVQQDHPDQHVAFEIAFTLQAILCGVLTVVALIAVPVFSLLYAEPRILAPGLLVACAIPLIAFQTPIWVFYRRMDFARTRILQGITPIVTFVVMLPLAIAGVGFWSLVIGSLVGTATGAVVAVVVSPYKLRLRYESGAMREYTSFSWPVLVSSLSGVVSFQVPLIIASRSVGAAAVGAITVGYQMAGYTRRVDDVVTNALYPAICAVKDRTDLLFESFSKSNRLALLWGFPAGVGLALFAHILVEVGLGETWKLAVPLILTLGLSAALDQIAFNWSAFARARAETRILALHGALVSAATLGVGVPLLLSEGLPGFALGIGAGTLTSLAVRTYYLTKIFPALAMVNHVAGAIVPTALGAGAVLLARALTGGGGTVRSVAEIVGYIAIVAAVTVGTQRPLLRESVGYLRRAARRTAFAP